MGKAPQVLINGVPLRSDDLRPDNIEEAVVTGILKNTPDIQKAIYNVSDKFMYSFFLERNYHVILGLRLVVNSVCIKKAIRSHSVDLICKFSIAIPINSKLIIQEGIFQWDAPTQWGTVHKHSELTLAPYGNSIK